MMMRRSILLRAAVSATAISIAAALEPSNLRGQAQRDRQLNAPADFEMPDNKDLDLTPYANFVSNSVRGDEFGSFKSTDNGVQLLEATNTLNTLDTNKNDEPVVAAPVSLQLLEQELQASMVVDLQQPQTSEDNVLQPMNMAAEVVAELENDTPEHVMLNLLATESSAAAAAATADYTDKSDYGYAYDYNYEYDYDYGDGYNYVSDGGDSTRTTNDSSLTTSAQGAGLEMMSVNGYTVSPTDRYDQYMVNLRLASSSGEQACGGTLIAPNMVLTAAHCLPRNEGLSQGTLTRVKNGGNDLVSSKSFVRIGLFDRMSQPGSEPDMEKFDIVDYFVTGYSRDGNQPPKNDIAIVRFNGCSSKTPAKWNTDMSKDLIENQLLHIVGWGVKGWRGGGTTAKLEEIDMRVDKTCDAWAKYNLYEENKDAICATSYHDTQGPCMGDSGGPAFIKGSSQADDLVIGVVSWGSMCIDAAQFPSVFTRIAHYQDWIQSTIDSNRNTSCNNNGYGNGASSGSGSSNNSNTANNNGSTSTSNTQAQDNNTNNSSGSTSTSNTQQSQGGTAGTKQTQQIDMSSTSGLYVTQGSVFELKGGSSADVQISKIGVHLYTDSNIKVYTRNTSSSNLSSSNIKASNGNMSSSGWTLYSSHNGVTAEGFKDVTWLDLSTALTIPKNQSVGVYVTTSASSQYMISRKNSNLNLSIGSGAVTVKCVSGTAANFGHAFDNYCYTGGLEYAVVS